MHDPISCTLLFPDIASVAIIIINFITATATAVAVAFE